MLKRVLASWCGRPADSDGEDLCAVNKTSQNSVFLGGVPIGSSFITFFESGLVIIKVFKATTCLNCIFISVGIITDKRREKKLTETIANLTLHLTMFSFDQF